MLTDLNVTGQHFGKGEILAFQDEVCNRLIFLLTGSVKGEMTGPSGKVIKVEDIFAPNPLAILFLFGQENRFPVQVTARYISSCNPETGSAKDIEKQRNFTEKLPRPFGKFCCKVKSQATLYVVPHRSSKILHLPYRPFSGIGFGYR